MRRLFFLMVFIFLSTRQLTAGSTSAPLSVTVAVRRTCSFSTSSFSTQNYGPALKISTVGGIANGELTVACSRGATSMIAVTAESDAPGVMMSVKDDQDRKRRFQPNKSPDSSQIWSDLESGFHYMRMTDGVSTQSIRASEAILRRDIATGSSGIHAVIYTLNF